MSRLCDLRTDHRIQPLNIDTPPVFSWKAQDTGANWRQTGRRIRVWRGDEPVWDSGSITDSRMHHVLYEGTPLEPHTAYRWQVQVQAISEDGPEQLESPEAVFETGMLKPSDWQGQWIGEDQDEVYHLYRRTFTTESPILSARLHICGLGHEVCMINGRSVTDAVLEPGWTDYRRTAMYCTYDVTGLLRQGANAISVMLGDGMYNVRGGRYVYYPRTYGKRKLLVNLILRCADGSRFVIATDERWRQGPSPILFSCIYGGEDQDGRVPFTATSLPDYDDSSWSPASVVEAPALTLRPQRIPPVKVMERYCPAAVTRLDNGALVYDLGTNMSGWVRLSLRTDGHGAGKKITLTPAELLNREGFPDQQMTRTGCSWSYVLGSEPRQEFVPHFSYTGFRYVMAEGVSVNDGADGLPVIESLQGEFLYPELEEYGEFTCSDELYVRIHRLIRQAMLSNIKSYFTDCPHREKLGWLEQTHLIGPAMFCLWDLETLYEKIEGDMMDSQRENGLVPDICPEYVTGFEKWHQGFVDSPEWGSACVLNPWHLYCRYGNTQLLREAYPAMKRYTNYLTSRTHHGLLHHGLGDWLDIGPCTPYSQNTPIPVTATTIYCMDLAVMAKVSELLGYDHDTAVYKDRLRYVTDEYNAQMLDDQTGRYANGSQAAQSMSLMAGLVPEGIREKTIRQLKDEVVKRGYAITAGDVGHPYLVAALTRYGMSELLHTMTGITETPGYGYQVIHGATTLTEEWDGPNPARPHGSQNHLMLGSLEEWFFSGLGGIGSIRWNEDTDHLVIKPHFARGMTDCRVSTGHPHGSITVHWNRAEDGITLTVTIPPNTEADISTEAGDVAAHVGSGTWTFSCAEEDVK